MENTMQAILSGATMALIFFVMEIYSEKKGTIWRYILVFLIAFLGTFAIRSYAEEAKFSVYNLQVEFREWKSQDWEEKAWEHLAEAEECIEEAREITLLLPCPSDKEKADYCLKILMGSWVGGTPQTKLAAIAFAFLSEYIPACINDWRRLTDLMHEARYHYEMAEFYEQLVIEHYGEYTFRRV